MPVVNFLAPNGVTVIQGLSSDPGFALTQFLDIDGHFKWAVVDGTVVLDVSPEGTVTFPSSNGNLVTETLNFPGISSAPAPAPGHTILRGRTFHGFTRLESNNEAPYATTLTQDSTLIVKNETGALIEFGKILYVSGSTNDTPLVDLAKAESPSTMPGIGVALNEIPDGEYAQIMRTGLLIGVNTMGFIINEPIWVDPTTGFGTNIRPTPPAVAQLAGICTVRDPVDGAIFITMASWLGNMDSGSNAPSFTLTGDLTVGTRTGTPVSYACFDGSGKIVESATPCV